MKTVSEFIADCKIYGDDKEFVAALWHFQSEAYAAGVERDLQEIERLRKELELEKMRLDWLLPRQHSHHTRQSIDKELSR
jgi:hypothetical protein